MNLFPTRGSALASALVALVFIAAALTGCSSGQLSQTATQEPAVNGTSGGVGAIALRDVRIRAQVTGAQLQPGESVELLFIATNQAGTDDDTLVSITSDVGSITLTPAKARIPASGSLFVGKPEGKRAEELVAATNALKATATVKLSKPITNGLTYEFAFTFERAGQAKLQVPITAGDNAPRVEEPEPTSEGH